MTDKRFSVDPAKRIRRIEISEESLQRLKRELNNGTSWDILSWIFRNIATTLACRGDMEAASVYEAVANFGVEDLEQLMDEKSPVAPFLVEEAHVEPTMWVDVQGGRDGQETE